MNVDKELVMKKVVDALDICEQILSARVYGSWLYDEESVDVDIAVIIPSHYGIVESNVYRIIKNLRKKLCKQTECDIDLVPHTIDEITNINSPLWYPRYNPSLVFGKDIKGQFIVEPTYNKKADPSSFSDFVGRAAYVILDNRTVCRRQMVRSFNRGEARIFVSKLLHGPGNALTYHSYSNGSEYLCPPSDMAASFENFDKIYGVDSTSAMQFLEQCKKSIFFNDALKLMLWYEHIVALTFHGPDYSQSYQNVW